MPDKRKFHVFLNRLKDESPLDIGLIESIQKKFDEQFDAITDKEKRALKQFPTQFVRRIPSEDMGWTTQLHMWAEQSVPEILDIDPMLLAFKNSYGDSVLMSLVGGATGMYTETINHDLIEKILNKDFQYEDIEQDEEGNDIITEKNALDVTDINGQTPIDFLIDFSYATGKYEGMEPEPEIQKLLKEFAGEDVEEAEEAEEEIEELPEDNDIEEIYESYSHYEKD